jgi:rhamnose utilization protein RhaD (predicted bifunctional aldolase and dehydrogenase)
MSTVQDPTAVSAELVALTRALGGVERDLVILAEGNTSQRLDDGRLVLKASGSRMRDADQDDFVVVDVEELTALVESPTSTQDDLTRALDSGPGPDGRPVRGSIEALIHVAVQAVEPTPFVGHTHPTAVVGLLASVHSETAFARAAYSDEAVVLGMPLWVPYAQPGIELGRVFLDRLRAYVDQWGELPRLVLLANHGIIAIADTAAGVEGVSEMAVKAARVRTVAYSVGGLAPLTDDAVTKFLARDDITERQGNLAAGRL